MSLLYFPSSLMTLLAGLLPDPDTSVAAISVAFNLYG
jgi:hypothetical protein